jgi:carbonic anhydrase
MKNLKQKILILYCFVGLFQASLGAQNNVIPPNPKVALDWLTLGNQRYVHEKLLHPNRSLESRRAVALSQNPFAVIVGCSDSRVSPEILFDQGIGDLFVVRVAGNVVGPLELDSIEFSALYLKSSIILVLGHENCGAIKAVVERNTKDIESVAALIEPAVKLAAPMPGNVIENTAKTNVRLMVNYLKSSPVLSRLIKDGKIDVVGGYYHLATGQVELLP